ncbi:oxidoreductase domain protein [Rhodopirellula baltica WH47]|uniref:Oxidoreductase domain protein n=1 Tax=Rhodopirellula baltica WH47 TaxID=991778 RepID=F2AQL9_RHOBT|nr:Gfo/Idh/MocA family oxidoreductase [Rhodopirellula baltica]EGF28029.1 oxidoreductase domain protein [Rhodopirellula baltica WH47]
MCIDEQSRRTAKGTRVKLRIGLIGLGDQWQSMHRPALRMLGDRFDVRAIYCNVSKLAESAVSEFQADPVDGYQALVTRDDIDAVLVLENSWLRFHPATAACRAGKAVYWASDLDFDPIRDREFKNCVQDSGVAFMAGLPRRFAPATLRLKELIATHLGSPRLIFCHKRLCLEDAPLKRRDQITRRGVEGNLGDDSRVDPEEIRARMTRTELMQLIDWCCYVVGERPLSVMSANHSPEEAADYQALSLLFDDASSGRGARKHFTTGTPAATSNGSSTDSVRSNGEHKGVTAQVSCGSYIPAQWQEAIGFRPPAAMQVCCENGVAFVDLPGTLVWFDDAGRHQEFLEGESPVGEKMLGQFHRAVTSLVRNLSGLEDAFNAAAILKAARTSLHEGRRVDLGDLA